MKVLMQARPGMGAYATGDVTQVRRTAAALEALGVEVGFSDSLEPNVEGVDVAHLFSTLQPHYTYLRLRHLRAHGVPVAVSTIYWAWDPEEQRHESIVRLGRVGYALSRLADIMRRHAPAPVRYRLERAPYSYEMQRRFYALEADPGLDGMRRYIYDNADVLLPNSHIEYEFLKARYGTRNDYVAVPNAVDRDFTAGDAAAFERRFGLRGFVLCCAAVQARKNQLRLIRAAKSLGLPLVLAGPEEARYAALCRAEAGSGVHFVGQLDGDDLRNAYAAARTHALVSFYETPGLASLEAAVAGATLLVSDRGSPREYFGEQASYCDPSDQDSITRGLDVAWRAQPDPALKERVLREFVWERTAEKTHEGYERAIAKRYG